MKLNSRKRSLWGDYVNYLQDRVQFKTKYKIYLYLWHSGAYGIYNIQQVFIKILGKISVYIRSCHPGRFYEYQNCAGWFHTMWPIRLCSTETLRVWSRQQQCSVKAALSAGEWSNRRMRSNHGYYIIWRALVRETKDTAMLLISGKYF